MRNLINLLHYFISSYFYFFIVRLLSVLRSHSFFSSPPQRPMTSAFEGFYIADFINFPNLILEKKPVFPFSMLSAKQGHYWYHFHNVFGMTRSFTGDWTRDLSHLRPLINCTTKEAINVNNSVQPKHSYENTMSCFHM